MEEIIKIYTDGASSGNPGKGGYGAILIHGKKEKSIKKGFKKTTNNRMELMAVISALRCIKSSRYPIQIYSDSLYVINGINKQWYIKWQKRNWKNVKNIDLWKQLVALYEQYNPKFIWVKGHSGDKYNEIADSLAVSARESKHLATDTYYEKV